MGTSVRKHSHADTANDTDDDMFRVPGDVMHAAAQSELRSFIERVQRLEKEKSEIVESIKEVYAELKGAGFDVKIARRVVALLKLDRAKRLEAEALLDLYLTTIGEE